MSPVLQDESIAPKQEAIRIAPLKHESKVVKSEAHQYSTKTTLARQSSGISNASASSVACESIVSREPSAPEARTPESHIACESIVRRVPSASEDRKSSSDLRTMLGEWDGLMKGREELKQQRREQGLPPKSAKAKRRTTRVRYRSKTSDPRKRSSIKSARSSIASPERATEDGPARSSIASPERATGDEPAMPPLAKCAPVGYRGCRIYTAVKQSCWRVYPQPGVSVYDRKIMWTANPAESWQKLIAYCKNPVLPASRRLHVAASDKA